MRRNPIVVGGATVLLVAGVVVVAAGGCGPSRRDTPFTQSLPGSDEQVARGQVAFMAHCNQCHPGGGAGLGPAINDKPLPGWLIRTQIRAGFGEMPGFDAHHVSDEDAGAIVAYLKALRGLDPRTAGGGAVAVGEGGGYNRSHESAGTE